MMQVGNAPLSWGVFEGDDAANPPWQTVLDEIVSAGYRRTELGPVGFLPEDPRSLKAELDRRELKLTAGFVYEHMHEPDNRRHVLDTTDRVARILAALGAPYLVVIDRMIPDRQQTAGRSDQARRLPDGHWSTMVEMIVAVATLASERYGLRPVLHPHCGTHIEFRDEIDRALSDVPPTTAGLCIDTGHSAVAGFQAAELVDAYPDRVEYFHFKDVDPIARERMVNERLTFDEALGVGLFCPIGSGMVDFSGLRSALARIDFAGSATVEQDPDPGGTRVSGLAAARASMEFLREAGLASDEPHAHELDQPEVSS